MKKRTEDRVLEVLKTLREEDKGVHDFGMSETRLLNELQSSEKEVVLACDFLEKHELIVVNHATNMVQITPSGLQLLDLSDLPDGELPLGQLEELERHWGDEIDDDPKALYTADQHAETTEGITAMAIHFDIRGNDVIHALWLDGKSTVWAKLAQDIKEKKRRRDDEIHI